MRRRVIEALELAAADFEGPMSGRFAKARERTAARSIRWLSGLLVGGVAAVVLGALPGSRLYQRLLQQERDRLQLQRDPW